jgi:hypothetical protein
MFSERRLDRIDESQLAIIKAAERHRRQALVERSTTTVVPSPSPSTSTSSFALSRWCLRLHP